AEEEARRKAEEEARIKAEEEARRKAEEEARRKAEEEARRKAEEEAKQKVEEVTDQDTRLKSIVIIEGMTNELGMKFIQANITSVAQIATSSPEIIVEKTGIEKETIEKIISSARNMLGL
ncbi:MAG: helix-hairpin-helix domain-containing protein, partial [Candidatus Helarchaeota archaeon]